MKKLLFVTLLSLNGVAMAQDIPKVFQGKWAGWYQVIPQAQLKATCDGSTDADTSMTMTVTKDKILLTQSHSNEIIENFKFSKINNNAFVATAKVTENSNPPSKKLIYIRKIKFDLDSEGLLELYKDNLKDRPRTDPRFWYRCPN